MLNPKQVLIKAITLLCVANNTKTDNSHNKDYVKEVIEALPKSDTTTDADWSKVIYDELRSFASELASTSDDDYPHISEVLQQVKITCRDEIHLYDALQATLEGIESVSYEEKGELIQAMRRSLLRYMKENKALSIVKDYQKKILFSQGRNDIIEVMREMSDKIAPYIERGEDKDPATIAAVNFDDLEGLSSAFKDAIDKISTEGVLTTGWQGLNRMLGTVSGIRRGDMGIIGALQHNFKSSIMMCLLAHFVMYNKPMLFDKSRKPLIIFQTLENDIAGNMQFLYRYIYENTTGMKADMSTVGPSDCAAFLKDFFEQSGFKVLLKHTDVSDYSLSRAIAEIEALQAQGFEIIAWLIDYVNQIPKTGIEASVAGDDIRLLYRRLRIYCNRKKIACLTPHQLSSDAYKLSRENVDDLTRKVAYGGYYDGCRRLGQEPDLELFIHIVKKGSNFYLDFHRGKHRYVDLTPEKDRHFSLAFQDIGTLPVDIGKSDTTVDLDNLGFDNDDFGSITGDFA